MGCSRLKHEAVAAAADMTCDGDGVMLGREDLERREQEILASYAVKSAHSGGREYIEEEAPFRLAFQRDRDRIVHSTAFRRLEYKTGLCQS